MSAAQAKEVQALQKTIEELKARIETMSKDMAALRDQRARQAAQTAPQKTAGNEARTHAKSEAKSEAKADRKAQAPNQSARRGAQPDQAPTAGVAAVTTAPAAAPVQDPMQGMNLRAVYPPSGADMQAWVMEGEVLRVVSRGSVIAGARVVDVLPDRVVTERGIIR